MALPRSSQCRVSGCRNGAATYLGVFVMEDSLTAREILDQIDKLLSEADMTIALEVWNVLSALRGPDVDAYSNKIKATTTAVIRCAALPLSMKRELYVESSGVKYSAFGMVEPDLKKFDIRAASQTSDHFRTHVRWAAHVLGLMKREEF
jgi:hypothetical protein